MKTLKIDKTQIRILAAASRVRYSDAQQAVNDLEAIINDMKIKLERAVDTREAAKKNHEEIMAMISLIEDS